MSRSAHETGRRSHDADADNAGIAAVLASGGLDSCVLLAETLKDYKTVLPVYVRTGLYWEEAEIYWLNRFIDVLRRPGLMKPVILDIPVDNIYGNHWSITGKEIPGFDDPDESCFLPGRNIILLSSVSVLCRARGIGTLVHGTLKGNPFPDATERFFTSMEQSIRIGLNYSVRILTPFRFLDKRDVMKIGEKLPLEYSFSCMYPRYHTHCGNCNKCAERIHAFRNASIPDRTVYAMTKK